MQRVLSYINDTHAHGWPSFDFFVNYVDVFSKVDRKLTESEPERHLIYHNSVQRKEADQILNLSQLISK